jgi:hypothetical protein
MYGRLKMLDTKIQILVYKELIYTCIQLVTVRQLHHCFGGNIGKTNIKDMG